MSVKVPQIQKRNHGLLLQAEKRNLQLFREIIIQKEGRLSKENCWQIRKRGTKEINYWNLHVTIFAPWATTLKFWQEVGLWILGNWNQISKFTQKKRLMIYFLKVSWEIYTNTRSQSMNHLHVPCLLLHHTQINHHHIQVILPHFQAILLWMIKITVCSCLVNNRTTQREEDRTALCRIFYLRINNKNHVMIINIELNVMNV